MNTQSLDFAFPSLLCIIDTGQNSGWGNWWNCDSIFDSWSYYELFSI